MWEKIEKLLKEKSMTKNKLATLAGINKNSLIDLKMGRKKSLKFEDVVKIADALDVSLDEFRKKGEGDGRPSNHRNCPTCRFLV